MLRASLIAVLVLLATPVVAQGRAPCVKKGTCRTYEFTKPARCERKGWTWIARRQYRDCRIDRRLRVTIDRRSGQITGTRRLSHVRRKRGRTPKAYRELIGQWSYCGLKRKAAFWLVRKNEDVFEYLEDPDRGPCVILRMRHGKLSEKIAKKARADQLVHLHPYVRRAARELLRRAWAAGVRIKVISVYRGFKPKRRWRKKKYRSYSHWHAWGLAFDVNFIKYKTLRQAKRRYKRDAAKWRKLGRIALDLGLTWSGEHRSRDIFHFEWHPGYGGWIRRNELKRILAHTGSAGKRFKKAWKLFPHPKVK